MLVVINFINLMNKFKFNSKIILISIVILALGLALYSFLSGQKGFNPFTTPIPEKIVVSDIPVKNFEADPIVQNDSGDSLIQQNQDFQISFVKQYNQFFVTILNPDFEATRPRAEQVFLNQLGITQQEACKLTVIVGSPIWVNPDLSGQTFGLSFCQ